ncbi:hypothetical protein [Enterococcus sp.]|jgi:hypothetical protein|uniref:hypothetical protein n=1 Tax=Enterococcus sp. TaxID=35783 RepID=UPI0025B7CBF6|nr:hypothetical protein [Enterococcus sp.]
MNYFKNLLAKSLRQRSFVVTLIAAFFIGVGSAVYLKVMEPINVQAEITMQKAQALRLVDSYQNYPNESAEKKATYQLLLENSTLASRQVSNLIMEEFPRFNRTSEELAAVQLKLWNTRFPDKASLQPIWQLQQNQVVSSQLVEEEKSPVLTADNTQTAVALVIQLMLGFGFLLMAFFASDNLLEEKRHFTLIHAYPQIFPIRMISKVGVKVIGHLAAIGVLIVGIFLTMAVIGQLGDWSYPTAVYYRQTWHAWPFWLYFLLAMVLLTALLFVTELLGFVVNVLIPNRYVSFFILCLCYGIGTLSSLPFSKYSPFAVFDLQKIITGEFAVTSQGTLGLGGALLLFLLWGMGAILFLIFADKKNWLQKGVFQ